MGYDIDNLLNGLRDTSPAPAIGRLDGIEARVWSRIETKAAARRNLRTQMAVGALALIVGFAASQGVNISSPTVDSESSVLSDDASLAPSMML